MRVEILNVAIVVLIKDHAAGVVHPLFLAEHGIAEKSWRQSGDLICTPPLSRVVYDSGIQVTAEIGKLSVHDTLQDRTPEEAIAPAIVVKYLQTLPQLNCTAVGVNFLCFLVEEKPSEYVLSKYLKSGPWNDDQRSPESAVINLNYRYEGYTAGFRIDVGTKRATGDHGEVPGVVFNANYNELISEVEGHSRTQAAVDALRKYSERLAHFRETAPLIME